MDYKELVHFMLGNHKEHCALALKRFLEEIKKDEIHMSQQAFSASRQKINPNAIKYLFEKVAQIAYETRCFNTFQGMRILAIDGTTLALPADKTLKEYYGCSGRGLNSPTAHASILYDITNDVILHAVIAPYNTDERTMANKHIAANKVIKGTKDLFLFDRGYASAELMSTLLAAGHQFIMRCRTKFNVDVDCLDASDGVVTFIHNGISFPIRVIKLKLKSGEEEVLLTSLFDKNLGIDDFSLIYFLRWGIETKYDVLKNKLQIENFTGRTVVAIKQDFYVSLYLSNMAAFARRDANLEIQERNEDKNLKYSYQANVNHIVGILKDDFIKALMEPAAKKRDKILGKILIAIAKETVPKRNNRNIVRPLNARDAKYHHNIKSAL